MNKKAKLIVSALLLAAVSFGGIKAYGEFKEFRQEKIRQQELKREQEEKQKAEEERLKAEEEERKRQKYGVGPNGEAYAYDAKVIWDKLSNYDYTNNGEKIAFLTFDDGPSTTVTPQILDILKEEGVKGTFFVLGQQLESEEGAALLKRIYDEGHAIANHTYSHNYKKLYPGRNLDLNAFVNDINATEKKAKEILGENFNINVVRCPGGYMSWKGMDELKNYLKENNKASIDWNALNGDAEGKKRSPQELLNRFNQSFGNNDIEVILMHDTYRKENTAKMLKQLINELKGKGYSFKTLV